MENIFDQNPTIRSIEKKEWANGSGKHYFEIHGIVNTYEITVRDESLETAIAIYQQKAERAELN